MVEFIGFFISFLALLYLFVKQGSPQQQRELATLENQPEEKDEDAFRSFLKALEGEEVQPLPLKKVAPPLPPFHRKEAIKKTRSRNHEEAYLKSSLEERRLEAKAKRESEQETLARVLATRPLEEKRGSSLVDQAMTRLTKKRDLIIYQEIIGKPIALRSELFPE